jgi:hypothetical protein
MVQIGKGACISRSSCNSEDMYEHTDVEFNKVCDAFDKDRVFEKYSLFLNNATDLEDIHIVKIDVLSTYAEISVCWDDYDIAYKELSKTLKLSNLQEYKSNKERFLLYKREQDDLMSIARNVSRSALTTPVKNSPKKSPLPSPLKSYKRTPTKRILNY